ncbi:MAG: hypothetical protein CVU54_18550 [Deltaproteobacteria bacterium HGW-Deltaproteobacteria-12]|jgi:hypothetical protein|nr:MAG: hypothetical protein CVU54_18550 [Deltaproteobacteria bacterium HGW-Deltaproteobacteria-12]
MKIPFTVEQFFDIFGTYNTAIWPVQILAYILGVVVLILAFRDSNLSARVISGILALFWIWMGTFYHIMHFSAINSAAWIFGIFYILQGLLFIILGVIFGKLAFRFTLKPLSIIGACFILYAMVIYPLLGISFGHNYPRAPMFGVAPCPTTIFTLGILLWTTKSVPGYLLVIPFLWSIIGMSAAVNLRVPQDYGLVVAGILGTALILIQNRKAKSSFNDRH